VTTSTPEPPAAALRTRIAPLTPTARGAFLDLLALATPGEPVPLAVKQTVYLLPGRAPFTHGPALCLTATTSDSDRPVGALLASVPEWAYTHPLCTASPTLARRLQQRVLKINGIAVHPDHRGQGIAHTLLDQAERRARRAGFALTILEHERHMRLTGFYTRCGYTVADNRLIVAVPGADLLCQQYPRRFQTAIKPLVPAVNVLTVPGTPTPIVSGLLPGCDIPSTARFSNGQLAIPPHPRGAR
jgi:GNAT superfamily N-acetyltransferase